MRGVRRWGPGLLLVSPSIILIAVFVYGLIGWNMRRSRLSDWREANHTHGFGGALDVYQELRTDPRWSLDVHHLLLFTVAFVAGRADRSARLLAFLLDKGVKGEGFFRSIYLFPMAVSFIAVGDRLALADEPGAGRPRVRA